MMDSVAVSDKAGTILGDRYEIIRELGRGGMATVYLANDRKHDREVALKVLQPDASAAIGGDRFAREIRTVARLQHPHILPLFDSGESPTGLFFVMPYVAGESLRQRLERDGPFALGEALTIARQIADALDYAHARGIVHRDVKPENIMLAERQALLTDFGIARAVTDDRGETLTGTGVTLGTPAYMSPEQACADRDLDPRSDVYSFACVCYEMLGGAPPFTGSSAARILSSHIVQPPPPLRGARSPLGAKVATTVDRALAKDPADRFQSVGAFVAELEACAAETHDSRTEETPQREKSESGVQRKSVFVLDFVNITGASDIDWLSTGIAETVGVDLNKIADLRVVGTDRQTRARTAGMGTGLSADDRALEIGRSLGARWVVWGGYQKAGQRIRLTPHFGDTESGHIITAEKIDGLIDDIFSLQDQIVTRLADALRINLTTGEMARIARPQTTDLSAYEHQANARRAFQQFGKEGARIANEHFRAALAIDPDYAMAWSGLGSLLMPKYIASGRREDLDEGLAALERAISLDPSLSEPYVYLSYMYVRRAQFDEAIGAARTAIAREPTAHMAWYLLGISHLARAADKGIPSEFALAINPLLRSIAINPQYHPAHMAAGDLYILRGQYGHAVMLIDKAVSIEDAGAGLIFLGSFVQRAVIYLHTGDFDSAEKYLAMALDRYPGMDHVYAETMTAFGLEVSGRLNLYRGRLDKAQVDFIRCIELAEGHERRLGIGAHWARANFGLSRVHHLRGDEEPSRAFLRAGIDMMDTRKRFVWSYLMGATEAETHYAMAAARATLGDSAGAIESLRRAASFGWSDMNELNHDPAFGGLRESALIRELSRDAAGMASLPAPVGSGGLPEDV